MTAIRVLALGAILLASPALAEGWKVESVTGDVVSVLRDNVQPLDPNDVVDEGSTIVSGPDSKVQLSRKGDSVWLDPNAMAVLFPGAAGHRALVEAKSGKVGVSGGGGGDGTILVTTKMFKVEVDTAELSVTARKDSVLLLVDSGKVEVEDPKQGAPFQVSAGDRFREPPRPAEDAEAKAKAEAAKQAAAPDAAKGDAKDEKKKHARRHSPLTAQILTSAGSDIKDGLDIIGESVDDNEPAEIPKIGMLKYLFGSGDLGPVLGGIALAFLGLGYLTSVLLGSAGFGFLGNAGILLIGAFLGAGFHDLVFTPAVWWDYEPYPGIFSTTVAGLLAQIGACFARHYLAQKDDAPPVSAEKLRVAGSRTARSIR